ncbi:MAG: putative DNA binding domain-containing protein [Candidatus Sumerlaeia bacterium]|nr:putative DNA binding domain-containing protein [Candidatus Sumerlaeia bacterium]
MNSDHILETELLSSLVTEDNDLEFKAAQGEDQRGRLPRDFWETYSAMANTNGGLVLLGVQEKPRGHYRVVGISDPARVKKQLWDCLNDRDKVSVNLLVERHVRVLDVETNDGLRAVVQIEVPRATRKQQPVYLTKNPFGNTFLRRTEGDYRASDEEVRRMIAEQVEDSRDNKVLTGFGIDDLDPNSLRHYRIQFANKRSSHVWANIGDREFLQNIGAFRKDRESGVEGLTAAGLLMFGRLPAITEHFYYYVLDYQEREEPSREARWVDRLTTDGSWSGNLYDFYHNVIQRLFKDLKVPFSHDGLSRHYETPIHEALQEALTNTLIHADYSGRVSVLVVKRPDLFGFRNPGRMRIPLKDALAGGQSDCRNRTIQTMFQLVGLGDRAGSGIPTILKNWTHDQHFRPPLLQEKTEPDQTRLTLPKVSLIPEETRQKLSELFGVRYHTLPDLHRLALATAELEGQVTHSRLAGMSVKHPADLSSCLKELVSDGLLEPHGVGRGKYYLLPGSEPEDDLMSFSAFTKEPQSFETKRSQKEHVSYGDLSHTTDSIPHKGSNIPHKSDSIPHKSGSIPHKSGQDSLESDYKDKKEWAKLMELSKVARESKRLDLEPVILTLCERRFVTKEQLGLLLGRTEKTLLNHYLMRMIREEKLEMLQPDKPKSPAQAYRTLKPKK